MKKIHFCKLIIAGLTCASLGFANPSDPTITQGNATFENTDMKTLVITTSDRTHVYWGNFSIAEGETTQIIQPSADSILVIQVDDDEPSLLSGKLQANGQVFLINPNGTLIGANGCLETSGFLATTFPVCACSFLESHEEVYFQGHSKALIVNKGRIKASSKNVLLIGYQIENKGAIDAPIGTAALASGYHVILQHLNAEKIEILPSVNTLETEETGIDNSGMINACNVELKADGSAHSVAIHHAGLIDAVGIRGQNCEVHIVAQNGNNGIFGAIAAENADGTGGLIQILGDHIVLLENSNIDASGNNEGGVVLIGDGAKTLLVDEGVVISADAIERGNGGKVIIGAEEMTQFYGTISACGGEYSGDGGYVELFGKQRLDFRGEIDQTAPHGNTGRFKLESLDLMQR